VTLAKLIKNSVGGGVILISLSIASGVQAVTITVPVTVNSKAGPWLWNNTTLNTAYQYGVNDNIAPSTINSSSGLDFAAGNALTINYLNGKTSAYGTSPEVDAKGYFGSYTANGFGGSSGLGFPSKYMTADWDTYLNQLVGTFADATGAIIGTPFAIGLGRTVSIPVGATQLQLGINDDIFADNTGELNLTVSQSVSVPEPSTIFGLGVLGFGAFLKHNLAKSKKSNKQDK
jgi:hypothetical protein